MRGIYVISLTNGVVKVGRSKRLDDRLRSHFQVLANYGADIDEVWSAPTPHSVMAEARTLQTVSRMPGVEQLGPETFRNVSFLEVVSIARGVRQSIAHLVDMEPPDVQIPAQAPIPVKARVAQREQTRRSRSSRETFHMKIEERLRHLLGESRDASIVITQFLDVADACGYSRAAVYGVLTKYVTNGVLKKNSEGWLFDNTDLFVS